MLNHIAIMGRLTKSPELRRTQSGLPVASFSLAVERDYKSQNGEREVDFIDCIAWRGTAEFVSKYFTKGQMAAVEGRLQLRDWTGKDGIKRRSAEVIANSIYFCGSKQQNGQSGNYQSAGTYQTSGAAQNSSANGWNDSGDYAMVNEEDGELPF